MEPSEVQVLRSRFVERFLGAWPEVGVSPSAVDAELEFEVARHEGELSVKAALLGCCEGSECSQDDWTPENDVLSPADEVDAIASSIAAMIAEDEPEPVEWAGAVRRWHEMVKRSGC